MTSQVVNYQEADPTQVATTFREARDDLGLTRKQVAEATGIPTKSLERIELGQTEPTISRAKILCRYYGISLTDMVEGMDTSHRKGARPAAPADMPSRLGVRAMYDHDDIEDEQSPEETARLALQSLSDFSEDRGPNAQGMRRRLRETMNAVQGVNLKSLIDLAEEQDFDLSTLPETARNGAADKVRKRLLIHAIYDIDLHQLSLKGMKALNNDLSDEMLGGVIDGPGMLANAADREAWRIKAANELADVVLDAVRKRAAPDLADDVRYQMQGEEVAEAA
jgi:transcriptional regulator with XRE-family HTH domain